MCRLLLLAFLSGGCHKLFDLEPVMLGAIGDGGTNGDTRVDGVVADAAAVVCPVAQLVFDEDGDSIDDRCDACPTVPNDDLDTDTDGLPNDCDPNLSLGGDTILFYATFSDAIDLTAFNTVGIAVWSANNKGEVALGNASRLRTTLDYEPTMIDVRTGGMTSSGLSATLTIGNTQIGCTLQASDCSETRNNATCLRFSGSDAEAEAFVTSLTRMTLSRSNLTTTCESFTSSQSILTSSAPIGSANVDVETNDEAQVVVRSIVIYGAK